MFSTKRFRAVPALLLSAALALALDPAAAQSGGVTLRITLSAESVEVLRAWRRAQGLDPPDPAADERVRQAAARRTAEAAIDPATAARLRRMARTVELVDTDVAATVVRDGY